MVKISVIKVSNKLGTIAAKLPGRAHALVQETVDAVEGAWKEGAPVLTGAYRDSIHGEMTGPTEGQVSSDKEYGPPLEWGTRFMPAQPSAIPAADRVRPQFVAGAKALVEGLA